MERISTRAQPPESSNWRLNHQLRFAEHLKLISKSRLSMYPAKRGLPSRWPFASKTTKHCNHLALAIQTLMNLLVRFGGGRRWQLTGRGPLLYSLPER